VSDFSPRTARFQICGVGDRLSKNLVGHGWPERSAHGCARSVFWKAYPQPCTPPNRQATSLNQSPSDQSSLHQQRPCIIGTSKKSLCESTKTVTAKSHGKNLPARKHRAPVVRKLGIQRLFPAQRRRRLLQHRHPATQRDRQPAHGPCV